MFRDILRHIGSTPHVQSLRTLWMTGTHALTLLEEAVFPGDTTETCQHLDEPLCALAEASWAPCRVNIRPTWEALGTFLMRANYSEDLHMNIIRATEDSMLLLQTVGALCGVLLLQTADEAARASLVTSGEEEY